MKCEDCRKEKAPSDYLFPLDNRIDVPYCRCIEWASLYGCAELSTINAKRLAKDADGLLQMSGTELYGWFSALAKLKPGDPSPTISDDEAARFASSVDYGRLITALSLLIISLQEVGKAALSLQGIEARKDLDYKKDYLGRFLNHRVRERAAVDLMKRIEFWPDAIDKRSKNLELLRQGSVYVDYSYNFGLWLDPTSLGSPEESGTMYSGALLTGIMEILGMSSRSEGTEKLDYLMVGGERFNTFGFAMNLSAILLKTVTVLESHVASLREDPQAREEFGKTVRLAEYLKLPEGLSNRQQVEELANRLEAITDLMSPAISGKVNRETRVHFGLLADDDDAVKEGKREKKLTSLSPDARSASGQTSLNTRCHL